MDQITLFYSWQSDREFKLCRNFIEVALNEAAEALQSEGIDLTLDSDTRYVSGTPPITAVILEKIASCDIFLGDVTFVAKTESGKHIPNPNVMAEYGYALHAKGYAQILLAINSAFGPPTELPFDLQGQRFPLGYDAPVGIADAERRKRRSALAARLVEAIKSVRDYRKKTRPADDDDSDLWSDAQQVVFNRDHARHTGHNVPAIVTKPRLNIHLMPLAAVDRPPLDPRTIHRHVETFMPPGFSRSKVGANEELWWASDLPTPRGDRPNPEARWAFAFIRPGLMEFSVNLGPLIDDDPRVAIPGRRIEAWLVRMSERLQLDAKALGLSGPAILAASLDGMEDADILGSQSGSFRILRPHLGLPSLRLVEDGTPVAAQLREAIDGIWLAAGNGSGSPSFGGGEWDGYKGGQDFELDYGSAVKVSEPCCE